MRVEELFFFLNARIQEKPKNKGNTMHTDNGLILKGITPAQFKGRFRGQMGRVINDKLWEY